MSPVVSTWKVIDMDAYHWAYDRWGGSFITHPDVIALLSAQLEKDIVLFGAVHTEQLVGAVATYQGWVLSHRSVDPYKIDLGKCEIILPLNPLLRFHLPWKFVDLSALHAQQIQDTHQMTTELALLRPLEGPDRLSSRTQSARRREQRRIIDHGCTIDTVSTLQTSNFVAAYDTFHRQRWGTSPRAIANFASLLEDSLSKRLFGYYIEVEGHIKALQIHYLVLTARCVFVEGVQLGHDQAMSNLRLGHAVLWQAYNTATAFADEHKRPLRYSVGYFERGYKEHWCIAAPLLTSESHLIASKKGLG